MGISIRHNWVNVIMENLSSIMKSFLSYPVGRKVKDLVALFVYWSLFGRVMRKPVFGVSDQVWPKSEKYGHKSWLEARNSGFRK